MNDCSPQFPFSTWRAVIARLIPTDDSPGALDENIDTRLLDQGHGPTFINWLQSLDQIATGSFAQLSAMEQDRLLKEIEAGQHPTVSPELFSTLVTLTAETFYTNPDDTSPHRTTAVWKLLGYSPRPASSSPDHG